MNVAVFGGFGKRILAPGWIRETAVAIFAGAEIDLAEVPPGDDASLTAIAIFGGIDIFVDPNTQVTMTGFNLFGGRENNLDPGDGPSMTIRAIAVFGGIEIKAASPPRPAAEETPALDTPTDTPALDKKDNGAVPDYDASQTHEIHDRP